MPKLVRSVEVGQLHIAGHFVFVLVALLIELMTAHATGYLPEDKVDDVAHRNKAFDPAELVEHHGGPGVVSLEEIEHLIDVLRRRHDDGRVHDIAERQRRSIDLVEGEANDILRMDEADQGVVILVADRHARVLEGLEGLDDFRHAHVVFQEVDARARCHDFDDFRLARFQQIVDKHPLGRVKDAFFRHVR